MRDDTGRSLGTLHVHPVELGGAPFDGLLGAPFFSYRRVVFDVATHWLLITPEDEAGILK